MKEGIPGEGGLIVTQVGVPTNKEVPAERSFDTFRAITTRDKTGKGALFHEVDWAQVFNDEYRLSYPAPYKDIILGNLDASGSVSTEKLPYGDPKKYIDATLGKPKVVEIIKDIKSGSMMWERFLIAIPKPDVLDFADRQKIQEALLDCMNGLMTKAEPHRLFEILENVVPVWFDSFELIEEAMPEIMRHPYIDVIPNPGYDYQKETVMRAIFSKHFPGQEDKLWSQLKKVSEWFFIWQNLVARKNFPLKNIVRH